MREWQPLWRTRFVIDGLFELVVDSGFEGMRKPEPEIYALTLARLGLPGEACAFVDDLEVNVIAARDAGMHGDPLPRHRAGDRASSDDGVR